jgi:hypothetical protein
LKISYFFVARFYVVPNLVNQNFVNVYPNEEQISFVVQHQNVRKNLLFVHVLQIAEQLIGETMLTKMEVFDHVDTLLVVTRIVDVLVLVYFNVEDERTLFNDRGCPDNQFSVVRGSVAGFGALGHILAEVLSRDDWVRYAAQKVVQVVYAWWSMA